MAEIEDQCKELEEKKVTLAASIAEATKGREDSV